MEHQGYASTIKENVFLVRYPYENDETQSRQSSFDGLRMTVFAFFLPSWCAENRRLMPAATEQIG